MGNHVNKKQEQAEKEKGLPDLLKSQRIQREKEKQSKWVYDESYPVKTSKLLKK